MTIVRKHSFSIVALAFFALALLPSSVWAGAGGYTGVQTTDVLQKDAKKMTVGGRFESGRVLTSSGGAETEYDNLRIHPAKFEYGLGDPMMPGKPLEVGGSIGYSSNSGDVEESGLEGISAFGQLKVNEIISPQAGIKIAGSDDVFPYGNDGLDLWFNVPASWKIDEASDVYGELGFTLKGGDFANYPNYGVGYRRDLNNAVTVAGELAGHGPVLDTVANDKSYLELRGKADLSLGDRQALHPSVALGLADGSPDFAVGAKYSRRF